MSPRLNQRKRARLREPIRRQTVNVCAASLQTSTTDDVTSWSTWPLDHSSCPSNFPPCSTSLAIIVCACMNSEMLEPRGRA